MKASHTVLLKDKQTDKWTDIGEYITFLVDVVNPSNSVSASS